MSSKDLASVVKRAIGDAAFRRQLQSDPKGALKGFHLTAQESAAITSGDPTKLSALGVDQRMSKAFGLGEATGGRQAAFGSDMSGTARGAVISPDDATSANTANLARIDPAREGGALRSDAETGVAGTGSAARDTDGIARSTGARGEDSVARSNAARDDDSIARSSGARGEDSVARSNAARDDDSIARSTGARGEDSVARSTSSDATGSTSGIRDAHDAELAGGATRSASIRDAHDAVRGSAADSTGTSGATLRDNPPFGAGGVDSADTAFGSGAGATLVDNAPYGSGADQSTNASLVDNPPFGGAATNASLVDNAPYGSGADQSVSATLRDNPPFAASGTSGSGIRDAHDAELAGGRGADRAWAGDQDGVRPADAFLTEQESPTGTSGVVSGAGDVDKGASLVDNPPFDASASVQSDDDVAGTGEPSNYP